MAASSPSQAAMAVSFDARRFSVVQDPFSLRWLLLESHAEEVVLLPPGDWSLGLAADGKAFVSPAGEGESLWCDDLCTCSARPHPSDGTLVLVRDAQGRVYREAEYRRRHACYEVPLKAVGRGAPCRAPAFLLQQSVDGAWVLWSWQDIYGIFVGAERGGPFGQWWYAVKPRQETRLGKLMSLCPALHLRRSSKKAGEMGDDVERIFSVATISTVALLVVLARCASPLFRGGACRKKAEVVECWRLALRALVETFTQEAFTLGLCLDAETVIKPGLPLQGKKPLGTGGREWRP